jgi:aspartate dehydrogenase
LLVVGMIGLGAIGRSVARLIEEGQAGDCKLAAVLVRDTARAREALPTDVLVTDDGEAFLGTAWDVGVEVAGHGALREHGGAVLAAGRDLMPVSVGAFVDRELWQHCIELAAKHGRRILIPSGAIGGLDMIGAAALARLDSVRHTVRKPAAGFGSRFAGEVLDAPRVLFEGTAEAGAREFPENVNVAAAVGLAGIGPDRTTLRVIADPSVHGNRHEVEVEGWFGRLRVEVENIPGENPKSGRVVALSVAKALRSLNSPVVVGL